jgi:hypothetical protein
MPEWLYWTLGSIAVIIFMCISLANGSDKDM